MRLSVTARDLLAGTGEGPIKRFALEFPRPEESSNAISLRCMGWLITEESPITAIVARSDDIFEWRTKPVPRADVERAFPEESSVRIGGFELTPIVLGLRSPVTLTLSADLGDRVVPLAAIELAVEPLALGYRPRLNPLLLSCGGRVGGSATMAAIASHPGVLSQGPVPYEEKPALYWIQAARILSNPANHIDSEKRFGFEHDEFHVGFSPFHCDHGVPAELGNARTWYKEQAPIRAFDFALSQIDSFYQALARDQGKMEATTFIEKASIGPLPIIMREINPAAREIFLVRDPRDVVRSILAFNEKRGLADFHAEKFETLEEHVRFLGEAMAYWMRHHGARGDSMLLVRYEDLVGDPEQMARRIYGYAELGGGEDEIAGFVKTLRGSFVEHAQHTTSASLEETVGRWRELPASVQGLCNEVFAEHLDYFGYR